MPQGTTLRNNPTTDHRRSKQAGTRAAIAKASKKRGSYGHFDAKTRAAIGKYWRAVVSSLPTAVKSCLHWSTETLQCLCNSLASNTMSTLLLLTISGSAHVCLHL